MTDDLVKRGRFLAKRSIDGDLRGTALQMADRIEALQAEHHKVRAEAHAAAIEAAKKVGDDLGYHCVGCGHLCGDPEKDIALLRRAGAMSCCPERKMEPISETLGVMLHTDASLAYLAARDERIKREAREETLRDMLGLTINHAPERDDIHAAITALIEKEGV